MKPALHINELKEIPLFFIVGRPRTGSTLLRTLFDAHPNVLIPQEWPMLLALYRQFGQVRFWDHSTLEAFYEALFQELRIRYWEITNWPSFDPDEMHSAILQCQGEHSFETVFKCVYSQYRSYFQKGQILAFGDKNPVYSNQVALLARIFPNAKFIHLTRDYRDQIVSMLDVDFEMPNVALLAYRWKYSWWKIHHTELEFPERFFTIRYEDLVADAPKCFGKVCNFLSLPDAPAIFEFHSRKAEIEKNLPREVIDRYFKSLFQPIDSSRVGIYRNRLHKRKIQIADLVVGSVAGNAGYRRDYPDFNLLIFIWSLPAVLYAKWLYSVGWLVSLLPYKTMMWLLNKPSVVVKLYTLWFSGRYRK